MQETKMGEIIRSSLDGIKDVVGIENAIGTPIHTPGGVTVIPVSKVSVGFASGGVDLHTKKLVGAENFGGGGGTGVSITPLAFLTVGNNAEINLIPIGDGPRDSVDRALSLIEHSPEIIKKIKDILS